MRKIKIVLNKADACLVRVQVPNGAVIAAIVVDDFLVAAEMPAAMKEFG